MALLFLHFSGLHLSHYNQSDTMTDTKITLYWYVPVYPFVPDAMRKC